MFQLLKRNMRLMAKMRRPKGAKTMKVTKLTVARALSQEQKYGKEWTKKYFQIEAEITEGEDLAQAKNKLEALLNEWLREA
jgi:hypothetical protein